MGVEIEMQIIDKKSLNLTPHFKELLAACKDSKRLEAEFYLSTAEINGTHKCRNVQEIEQDFEKSVKQALAAAKKIKVKLAATGCHPLSKYNDCQISPSKRYIELAMRNQWIAKRMTVYGLHIHLGMKSGDDYIKFSNFFSNS